MRKSIKKPTHFLEKELLSHLGISREEFQKLRVFTEIYKTYPTQRRYKGRRSKAYYSKQDIKYLRNSAMYQHLFQKKRIRKKLGKYRGRNMELERKNLIKRIQPPDVSAILYERYSDWTEFVKDMGDVLSMVFLIYANRESFKRVMVSGYDEVEAKENEADNEMGELVGKFGEIAVGGGYITGVYAESKSMFFGFKIGKAEFTCRMPYSRMPSFGNESFLRELKVDFNLMRDYYQLYLHTFRRFVETLEANAVKSDRKGVFSGLVFVLVLERMIPMNIKMLVESEGGRTVPIEKIADKDRKRITHLISDVSERKVKNRILEEQLDLGTMDFAHFQWVLDSFNEKRLLPVHPYQDISQMPVHKNPFTREMKDVGDERTAEDLKLGMCLMTNRDRKVYKELEQKLG